MFCSEASGAACAHNPSTPEGSSRISTKPRPVARLLATLWVPFPSTLLQPRNRRWERKRGGGKGSTISFDYFLLGRGIQVLGARLIFDGSISNFFFFKPQPTASNHRPFYWGSSIYTSSEKSLEFQMSHAGKKTIFSCQNHTSPCQFTKS